jgi:hypothetical protein
MSFFSWPFAALELHGFWVMTSGSPMLGTCACRAIAHAIKSAAEPSFAEMRSGLAQSHGGGVPLAHVLDLHR